MADLIAASDLLYAVFDGFECPENCIGVVAVGEELGGYLGDARVHSTEWAAAWAALLGLADGVSDQALSATPVVVDVLAAHEQVHAVIDDDRRCGPG
ncbi:hypothetical protein, partial [Streptomyces sp. DSM 41634]|uniref:hypothetical protein n=1 Tax=Streptomyces sp. DSM 41634 TaxID=3448656 RepID=UPI00403FF392